MEGYRFSHEIRVRWVEVDAQQIVFNAHYLTYADIAFAEYLRRGLQVSQGNMLTTVIAKTSLTFLQPARYDELVTVHVRTARLGKTSMTVEFTMERDGMALTQIETTYVHVDVITGRPSEIPDHWRTTITTYEPALSDQILKSEGTA